MLQPTSKNFRQDVSGNVAVSFAGSLVLLLLIIGFALNTIQLQSKKEKLNHAADAGVLAAVKAISDEINVIESGNWEKVGLDIGTTVFERNIGLIPGIGEVTHSLEFTVDDDNRDISGKLTYTTEAETILSSIMGVQTVTVSNYSEAKKSLFKFARINFLIDVSSSMGIGADLENQELLSKLNGCAIACHGNGTQINTVHTAREHGIKLRIDTLKGALTQLVEALKLNGTKNEFEVGLYTFSNSVDEHLAPTTDLESVLKSIENIELTGDPFQGGTNLQHSLNQLGQILPTGGDGKGAKNRQSFIVVLTDGVENSVRTFTEAVGHIDDIDPNFRKYEPSMSHDLHTIQGFNPKSCADMKYKNHTLAFINPEYLIPKYSHDISDDARAKFEFIKKVLIPNISRNSKSCSSSRNFAYSAQSELEVQKATKDLFNDLLGESVRLSK